MDAERGIVANRKLSELSTIGTSFDYTLSAIRKTIITNTTSILRMISDQEDLYHRMMRDLETHKISSTD